MNILISAAGRRVRLVHLFREAVARLGLTSKVYACDSSPMSAALYAADEHFLAPPACDAEHIPFLLGLCADRQIGLVVSVNDAELVGYAEAREQFDQQGTTIAIPSSAGVRMSRDKRATHEWFLENGFPAPRRWLAGQLPPLEEMPFPVIVKPARGSAGIGVKLIHTGAELERAVYATADPVIEERQTGREFTVNVLASREGKLVCAVPHLRLEIRAGEVSKGRTFRHEELGRIAGRLVERLPGCRGPVNFQGFLDASGGVRLTEINPRFGGGYPLAHAAGARFPEWLLMERLGRAIPRDFVDWRSDIVMLRYDMEIVGRQVAPDRIEPL
ncbi:MAG TPA: ATP-grasp domain-containing protein [Gemmatimonadales bacterium]|nr:ATP-grasp domain-containing protein [Gemmatimonadales bacterium]